MNDQVLSDEPLSSGAEALWALQQLVPTRGVSNVALAIELDGAPRWWPLQEALSWLVARHPALCTCFPSVDGAPVRRLHTSDGITLDLDVVASSPESLESDMRAYAARPFDLDRPPLLRVGLFAATPKRHVICLVAHHIVVDAVSLTALQTELGQAYDAVADSGSPPALADPVPVYVPEPTEEALDFWRSRIAGADVNAMRLEEGRDPEGEPTFAGELQEWTLSKEAYNALATLRRRHRATDAMVLLAVYYTVLRGHGASADSLIGVMTDMRGVQAPEAVGYHVATVPLRVTCADEMGFGDVVARVMAEMIAGFEVGPVSFELLARESALPAEGPGWWRSRLVRHLFNFRQNRHGQTVPAAAQDFRLRDVCTGLSRFDLELTVEQVGNGLSIKLLYSTEVFDERFAERFLPRFESILCQAAADADRAIGDFNLFSEQDHAVIAEANATRIDWPACTVPEMIASAAGRATDRVAVDDGSERTSYAELLETAATVRDVILSHAGGPGTVVAIASPRSAATVAAVLGVWAAGAAYLPLDPSYPAERLSFQLNDAQCGMLFGGEFLPAECREGRTCLPAVLLQRDTTAEEKPVERTLSEKMSVPRPEDLAYLIYTSGSTGQPKGVRLSHANLANVVRHFVADLGLGNNDSTLWLTTFAFDISALELCLPLVVGGRVVVAPDDARSQPELLLDLVTSADVSVVQATPTTWRLVAPKAEGAWEGRTILCGGEPLSPLLAHQLRATNARVLNVYGPTETTIWSTAADLTADDAPVSVGRPIANTTVEILDPRGIPRPVGLPGELIIGGRGVALDYHRRPELTAESFSGTVVSSRAYRTGDRARWRADGTIELLGRSDRQVKLRGHRVELGEVEHVLENHPEVLAAAVVPQATSTDNAQLVAFVAAARRPGLIEDLWTHAALRLPGYSVPSQISAMPTLPTTANGKVDYQAIATLPTAVAEQQSPDGDLPEDAIEAMLIETWRTALGRPTAHRDSNFFLNGGQSLLAARVARELTQRCGFPVSMGMLFQAPTPAALAVLVRVGTGGQT